MKNIATLLTDSFGSARIAAASLDTRDGTIIAYPIAPKHRPYDDRWTDATTESDRFRKAHHA